LTLPRVKALQRYWRDHPPVHLMIAGYLGYKPPGKPAAVPESQGNGLAELMALGRPE
jgi:hypothetical protein